MIFRSWKFWAILIPSILVAFVGLVVFKGSPIGIDSANPPQFIQADFVDLSQIYSVSKFRSGEGHDFSGNGETCRSMKHYFRPQEDPGAQNSGRMFEGYQLPPEPDGKTDISIFSPVDGRITSASNEHTPIGKQVGIVADSQPRMLIRLFHIYLDDGFRAGTKVKAGQKIGVIGKYQGTDIAIQAGALPWNDNFISYFSVMPDAVFASYEERGATSRDDFTFSKEYRDAHPLQCNGEQFVYPANYDQSQDDFHLSGYILPDYSGQTPDDNTNTQR